jgi:hypothetical protein
LRIAKAVALSFSNEERNTMTAAEKTAGRERRRDVEEHPRASRAKVGVGFLFAQ